MKKIYVKIDGITCDHCRNTISQALLKETNIKNIYFDGNIAKIEYNGNFNKDKIIDLIVGMDYYTNEKMIHEDKKALKRAMTISQFLIITIIIIFISFILNKIFGFNIFNMIPVIDSKTTLTMLFITGLLTSIHCISMCGAINLIASSDVKRNFKKPLLYNLGRLTSYTLIGGIVGLIGSVLQINIYVQGIIIIIASLLMLLMALNMMGITSFSLNLKLPKVLNKKEKGSYVIGLLNGFMPCGPLQAMQVYALSTGSFFYGALSMFLFCLGTIPLMLFMGVISNFLSGGNKKIINKISTVLILLLSLTMMNRGLLGMGIDVSDVFKTNYDEYVKAVINDNYQVIEFDLSPSGYRDIVVQKGIPVKIIMNVADKDLTGCNNEITIREFSINQELKLGQNVVEFIPNETGTFTYTCWMNMLKNKIRVVDDFSIFDNKKGNS